MLSTEDSIFTTKLYVHRQDVLSTEDTKYDFLSYML